MKNLKRHNRQTGYSMLELLVAMTIGLSVLTAAVAMQVSHRKGYKMSESKLGMQTNAKFAFEFIAKQLREVNSIGCRTAAGYVGATSTDAGGEDNVSYAFNDPNVAYANFQLGFEMLGHENNEGASTWTPPLSNDFGFVTAGNMEDGSDAITLRGGVGETYVVAQPGAKEGDSSVQLDMTDTSDVQLKQNFYASISNCTNASVFKITSTDTQIDTGLIARAAGTGADENVSGTFAEGQDFIVFGDDIAELRRMAVTTFYVANNPLGDPNGVPTLYRDVDGQSTPLVEGVERMQIEYGVNTDKTTRNTPDIYLRAATVHASCPTPFVSPMPANCLWPDVVSVRVSFIMRSKDRVYEQNVSKTYTLPGISSYTYSTNDNYVRLIYSATVSIRNRMIGDRTDNG